MYHWTELQYRPAVCTHLGHNIMHMLFGIIADLRRSEEANTAKQPHRGQVQMNMLKTTMWPSTRG
jgi:hypothetical protein